MVTVIWAPIRCTLTMLHSFAFGGRGIFVVSGRSSSSRNKVKIETVNSEPTPNSNPNPNPNPNLKNTSKNVKKMPNNVISTRPKWTTFLFMLVMMAIVWALVVGDNLTAFDNTCGFPGEGPKMTSQLAQWYQQNFTDNQIRIISNKIVHQGLSYRRARETSGRYNFVGDELADSRDNAAYTRLRHDVARVRKMKKKNITANR